jgi:hypothetical protein
VEPQSGALIWDKAEGRATFESEVSETLVSHIDLVLQHSDKHIYIHRQLPWPPCKPKPKLR